MSPRVTRAAVAAALLLSCRQAPRPLPASPAAHAAQTWPAALTAGRMALTFRQFGRADSVFAAFERAHPGSAAAAEAGYWRAVAGLDPQNAAGDTAASSARLDAYRATDPPGPHYVEAGVMRGLAARVDSLRLALAYERSAASAAAAAASAARAALVPRDTLRVRDEELERMRGELAMARAELERVRRRLAAPGPAARLGQ